MPTIPATAAADDALVAPPADEGKRLWRGIASLVLLVLLVGALVVMAIAAIPGFFLPRTKPVPVEDDTDAEGADAAPILMHP